MIKVLPFGHKSNGYILILIEKKKKNCSMDNKSANKKTFLEDIPNDFEWLT